MATEKKIITLIEQTYIDILERPADHNGLKHYLDRWQDKNDPINSVEELTAVFKLSDEYAKQPLFIFDDIGKKLDELQVPIAQNSAMIKELSNVFTDAEKKNMESLSEHVMGSFTS